MAILVNFKNKIEFEGATLKFGDSWFRITVYGNELMAKMKEAKKTFPYDDCYTGEEGSAIYCKQSMGTVEFFQAFIIWQNWLMGLFPTYQMNFLEQFNNDWSDET